MLTTISDLLYDIWQEIRFYYCQPYKRIHKFTMDLIPNDWKHLLKTKTSQQKNLFWIVLFCGMVGRRKVFSLIFSRDHCQRSSPSGISDTPRAGFEPAQSLSSVLVEWCCAVVIAATPRWHYVPIKALRK